MIARNPVHRTAFGCRLCQNTYSLTCEITSYKSAMDHVFNNLEETWFYILQSCPFCQKTGTPAVLSSKRFLTSSNPQQAP